MKLPEMVQDRKAFSEKVQENAVPDLQKFGLTILSFNIQSFEDGNNVIENLGIDNISQIQKSAAIAKANAEKEVKIAKAEADRQANDAEVESQRIIAEKQNELAIKKAELKIISDTKKADADVAYDIQKEEKRKEKEEKTAEANIIKEQKQIEIRKAMLDAENKQQADVNLYERQKKAEASLYEKEKEAEAVKLVAEKEAEAIKIKAEAEAESKRRIGIAEAEAIKAKALAEAEGINAKAEAMQKYGEAAMLEMYFKSLPEVAKNVAEPLSKVDKITMYGDGNNAKLVQDITKSIAQISGGLNESMGIDINSLMKGVLGKFGTTGESSEVD